MGEDSNFSKTLRQELSTFQERRHAFRLRKLSFVATLFGLGSAHIGELNFVPVLFLVPAVAFFFDLYILAEDYGIKRIGAFLRQDISASSDIERAWEQWVNKHPSRISPFTSPLVTLLVLGGAAIVLWNGNVDRVQFWVWITTNIVANIALITHWSRMRKRFEKELGLS